MVDPDAVAAGRAQEQQRRRTRPWRAWYKDPAWQRRRAAQLAADPLCRFCLDRGIVRAATVADHVKAHRGNRHLFFNGALQSLCKQCHDGEKQAIERRCERVG